MNEYIPEALSAIRGSDPDRAQAYALVSIAESLAVLAGDLREERLRTESLRAELGMARQEAENAAGVLDAVVEILHSDKPDAHRIKAIAKTMTQ